MAFASWAMLMIACVGITSCNKDDDDDKDENPIVGVWLFEEDGSLEYTVLGDNGSLEMYVYDPEEAAYGRSKNSTYTYADGKLTMKGSISMKWMGLNLGSQPLNDTFTATLSGDVLSLSDAEGTTTTMKRVSDNDKTYQDAKNAVVKEFGY